MGHSLEGPNQDAHLSRPTNHPWRGPPPHGSISTSTTDAAPLENVPQDPQHPQRPRLQDRAVYPVSAYWRLQPNDTDVDQDH